MAYSDIFVLETLIQHANSEGIVSLSLSEISQMSDVPFSTTVRCIQRLILRGQIAVVRSRQGARSIYQIKVTDEQQRKTH